MTTASHVAKMSLRIEMPRISDNEWREDIKVMMDELGISMEELGKELGITKGRVSQILKAGALMPYGWPEKAKTAIQRIMARKAESVGLRVIMPKED